MTIFNLIRSAASNLRGRLVSLARTIFEAEGLEAGARGRDWEEAEYVFQRRHF